MEGSLVVVGRKLEKEKAKIKRLTPQDYLSAGIIDHRNR